MSRRQDYIARVRYQNELPPPPCGPKLLKNDVDVSTLLKAGSLSGAVLARPANVDVDMDLGMPLDLIKVPHAFSEEFDPQPEALEPADLELLAEPAQHGSSGARPSSGGVSFLRRTEYMTTDGSRTSSGRHFGPTESQNDPEEVLRAVEETFEQAQVPLDKLVHPKNKKAKAVSARPLLPDTKILDLTFSSVRMVGSASLKNLEPPLTDLQLRTAVFNAVTLPEDEEESWMGMFVPENDEDAQKLLSRIQDVNDNVAEEFGPVPMTRVQENDIDFAANKNDYDEIVITYGKDQAYYVPVIGRTSLKRRRVAELKQALVNEHSVGALNLGLREIDAEESLARDAERSKFDPVTYSG